MREFPLDPPSPIVCGTVLLTHSRDLIYFLVYGSGLVSFMVLPVTFSVRERSKAVEISLLSDSKPPELRL